MNNLCNDDLFIEIWCKSSSISDLLRKMGHFGNKTYYYPIVKNQAARLGLTVNQFMPVLRKSVYEIDKILSGEQIIVPHTNFKKQLIKRGYLHLECQICKVTPQFQIELFDGRELQLQLDHIDGDRTNNKLENLRLLCPNCHSRTDTFTGRNTKRRNEPKKCLICNIKVDPKSTYCKPHGYATRAKVQKKIFCSSCNALISRGAKMCKNCARTNQLKIVWPSNETILQMLETLPMVKVAKLLGVSDNAVKKHLKQSS